MQQSARYSVDNYSGKNFLTFNLRGSIPQKFPAIRKFLHIIIIKTVITANKFNLRGVILKNFQQSERFIAIKCKVAEIILKFDLRVSNLKKFQ